MQAVERLGADIVGAGIRSYPFDRLYYHHVGIRRPAASVTALS